MVTKTKTMVGTVTKNLTVLLMVAACVVLGTIPARAEFEDKMVSARALAMGGAFVAVADDASAVYWNPGALPQVRNLKITTMHAKLFSLADLRHDYLAGATPVPYMQSVLAGSWSRFGGRNYREDEWAMAIAREMGEHHMMGIALRQLSSKIVDTPTMEGFAIDAGLLVKVGEHLRIGLMARNLNKPEVNDVIPQVSKLGVAIQAFPNLILAVDAVRESSQPLQWHIGEEYYVNDNFALRAGYSTNPKRLTAGFGFTLEGWNVDYAYMTHDVLPPTHRVSLSMDFWKSHRKKGEAADQSHPPEDTGEEAPQATVEEPDEQPSATEIKAAGDIVVNVNTANPEDLVKVPGIGPSTANNIVLYRELNGLFASIDQLLEVPRIGEKLLEKIKPYLTVGEGGE